MKYFATLAVSMLVLSGSSASAATPRRPRKPRARPAEWSSNAAGKISRKSASTSKCAADHLLSKMH